MTPLISSPPNGGWLQLDSWPGGTTSVWPAKQKCGCPLPCLAKRFSTSAVPASLNRSRSTWKSCAASTPSIKPSAPPSAGVTDRQPMSCLSRGEGSIMEIAIALLAPLSCTARQRVGSIPVGPLGTGQAAAFDQYPDRPDERHERDERPPS